MIKFAYGLETCRDKLRQLDLCLSETEHLKFKSQALTRHYEIFRYAIYLI